MTAIRPFSNGHSWFNKESNMKKNLISQGFQAS